MTSIIDGKLVLSDLTKNSKGGTELMAQRMVDNIDPELLKQFNIIHSRVEEIDDSKPNILVLHDLPNDPASEHLKDPESRKRFSKLVFVSHWQQQYYNLVLGIPFEEGIVMPNAIKPIDSDRNRFYKNEKIRLIYHTTPHRGLELLIPVYKKLQESFDNIHLDVYSSFDIYGWGERDQQYQKLFEECNNNEGITYHGAVSNDEVREALKYSHIFAYPSIWPETSCLALIEAMSAENICV